ncbi:hypothetical protein FE391_28180 [Nonomuraea sp. KC401]|uniref:hypothetical protein n=1 Tax=unclassified Nonomuraea TaxID=2593643 RepID=UPI0010FEFC9A|nr:MULTISPECIES: hypothetical protein [unclassified Nonomuraea]NBE95706.1 hypothetical protein [Nonomuraea sp. K271]TLF63968.1 hypothetical protein FE391_28180 [Nonomuraea sp. KC401]
MHALLTISGWLLLLQGVGGLINALFGWWRWAHDLLVVNLPFLEGYEVFAAIVIGVLGFVLLAAADVTKRTEGDR